MWPGGLPGGAQPIATAWILRTAGPACDQRYRSSVSRRLTFGEHAVLALCSSVLALLACWPLPLHLDDALVGEKMVMPWAIAVWLTDLPLHHWLAPAVDWLDFPEGNRAVLVGLPQVLVSMPLRPLVGHTAAMNLSLLLHIAAGVHLSAALVHRLLPQAAPGPRLAAALAGGSSIGLSCLVLSVLGNGQPENLGIAYVAMAGLGAVAVVRDRRGSGLLAVAVGVLLAFFSSPYLLMGPLIGAALLLLPLWWSGPGRRLPLVAVAAVVLAVSLPAGLHFRTTTAQVAQSALCPAELDPNPPDWRTAALPQGLVTALRGTPERGRELLAADPAALARPGRRPAGDDHLPVDYLGLLPLLAGLAGGWRSKRSRWLLGASGLTLLLALGPTLLFNGWALTTPSGARLRLPLDLLQSLPGAGAILATIQVPARLLVGTTLFLGLAGAPAWLALATRLQRLGPGTLLLLGLAPAAEQLLVGPAAPPMPIVPVQPRDAWVALGDFDDQRALLETPPIGWDLHRRSMLRDDGLQGAPPIAFQRTLTIGWALHRRPMPVGSCPGRRLFNRAVQGSRFQEAVTTALEGGEGEDLGQAAAEMVSLGFGWYVIHTGTGLARPEAEARLVQAARQQLELVHQGQDGTWLFRLPGWQQPAVLASEQH